MDNNTNRSPQPDSIYHPELSVVDELNHKSDRTVLVIVPTYNESENISKLIPRILQQDQRFRVLIVDDSSPDGTAQRVKALQADDNRISLIERPGKLGLGTAYVHGFGYALENGFDEVISMDGDFSHDPKYLPAITRLLSEHDVVIGSRYVDGGGTRNWSIVRRILSRAGNFYARAVLGMPIHDCSAGFIGYRRKVLEGIPLSSIHSEGYSFLMEMKFWAHTLKFSLREMPIVFTERSSGRSKISRAILIEALWMVWKLRFTVSAHAARIKKDCL